MFKSIIKLFTNGPKAFMMIIFEYPYNRAATAGKAGKVWSFPRFWVSIRSYKKQLVKKFGGRILDLAWLKFTVAALSHASLDRINAGQAAVGHAGYTCKVHAQVLASRPHPHRSSSCRPCHAQTDQDERFSILQKNGIGQMDRTPDF